jgi:hypothetical protein
MTRRKTFLTCTLLALCLFPGVAAAEETVQAAAPASGCDATSFLAPAAPAASTPAMNPFAGAIEAQGGACCFGKLVACNAGCVCGVFEFNCDPATCQSSCICNICP